ncbi:MAG: aminotransferase class IV [Thermoleophilaceae bacterium]|jgi:branched-chain amino acid aminotransferase|nr:aminotransferase class IV [Thermoleophilaceae bacterium]MDQ3434674.1 aminotransferase class IV [Actinomycetota bacterium]
MSEELACLDGSTAPAAETTIPVTDEGFLRGDGAFEVIRVYDGQPFALDEHFERMERSAANLRLPAPFPRKSYEREIPALLEARGGAGFDGCLRLVFTREGRRLAITEQAKLMEERVRLGFVTFAPTRVLDGVKSLSYAANMLCSRLARERGFDEALLVTPHGRVLEGPTSSLFWVDGSGTLCTPPLEDHILASITRAHLLNLVDVTERPVTTEELLGAQEAFMASTVREVQPVAAIEDREFGETGEMTRKVAAAFSAHVDDVLGRR